MLDSLEDIRRHLIILTVDFLFTMPIVKFPIVNCADQIAKTDGVTIFINFEKWKTLSFAQKIGVLLHEWLHIALFHSRRVGSRDFKIWNMACDFAINYMIYQESFNKKVSLPNKSLLDLNYANMTAEEIYNDLINNQDKPSRFNKKQPSGCTTRADVISMIKTKSTGDGFMNDMLLPGSGGNVESLKQEVLAASENCKKVRGSVPAIYERELGIIKKGKVHWATIFHSLSKQVLFFGKNRSFAKPKPYGWLFGLALPGNIGIKKPNITVIFDTSGSISKSEMATFVAEVVKAFQHCDVINVITADCKVNEVVKLNRIIDILPGTNKIKFIGGGGTNFVPALKEAAKLRSEMVIYFTDGEGKFGEEIRGMRLLWVLTSSKVTPPFGRYIVMDEEEI